jgi:hypothetical protein
MPVWTTTPVDAQPSLTLVNWQVMQLPDGDRHFVGYSPQNREGRTSSAIVEMDLERLQGVTSTGRVYQLIGTPGWNTDAEYVWRRWIAINDVPQWEDVSKEVWSDHLASKHTPWAVKPQA